MEKTCRVYDLGRKEVINLATGQVAAIVIPGRLRFFGLLGREDDVVVAWDAIERLGEDIIFVREGSLGALPGGRGRAGFGRGRGI
jgi:sporulation protein YlmC with PRC-barrel domain